MKTRVLTALDICESHWKAIASSLQKGEAIGFPTDTVYGLGVDIENSDAHRHLYRLKQRPQNKAFIVHMGKIEHVHLFAQDIPQDFYLLAKHFFPGGLTLVLPKKKNVLPTISDMDTIACRMPDHPLFLALIEYLQKPIVGTSANLSGEKNPLCAKDVLQSFNEKIPYILDGGSCPLQVPSTVLSLVEGEPLVYREGAVSIEKIEAVLNKKVKIFCCI